MKTSRQSTVASQPAASVAERFLSRRSQRSLQPLAIHHITLHTEQRHARFHDLWIAREVIRTMKAMHDYDLLCSHAFVLMPDHLHWLISLKRDDAQTIVQQFKVLSARALARRFGLIETLWSDDFADDVIDNDDSLIRAARHVVANPLRASLVQRLNDYPHWDAEWIR